MTTIAPISPPSSCFPHSRVLPSRSFFPPYALMLTSPPNTPQAPARAERGRHTQAHARQAHAVVSLLVLWHCQAGGEAGAG